MPKQAPGHNERPKPIDYYLNICYGTFDGDSVGIEATTPFFPLAVGDTINPRFGELLKGLSHEGKDLRVTGIRHSFQFFDNAIHQYVDVRVEVE